MGVTLHESVQSCPAGDGTRSLLYAPGSLHAAMHLAIEYGPETPYDLRIYALHIARSLQTEGLIGSLAEAPVDEVGADVRVRATGEGRENLFELSWDGHDLRLRSDGGEDILPIACAGQVTSARRSGTPVVLFSGSAAFSRRLRMTARTVAELRRRGTGMRVVALGPLPSELTRLAPPDDHFPDLDDRELSRLVSGAAGCLETVDDSEPQTILGSFCAAAGVPVLVHRSARGAGGQRVEEWSADSFCDGLAAELPRGPVRADLFAEARQTFLQGAGIGI